MATLELDYRNYRSASCDGGTWNLDLEAARLDGREVTSVDELDDLLVKVDAEQSYLYFWDNPVVYGVPKSTLKVAGHKLRVEELAEGSGWDEEATIRTFKVEV